MHPERGELWWLDWTPGRGSEQIGRRPGLVVQAESGNRNPRYSLTIVLAVSRRGHPIAQHVRVEPTAENGLSETSFIKTEQIQTVSKARLQTRIGRLDTGSMTRVESALKAALGIP